MILFAALILCLFLTLPIHVLWAAGLLWSPFNAMLCFKAAKGQSAGRWRYGVAGAVYSAFLIAPGVYLLMRLRGSEIQQSQIVAAYLILYGLWILALVGSSWFMFLATGSIQEGQHISPYYGAFAAVMLVIAIISGIELYAFSSNKHPFYRQITMKPTRLLNRAQLSPFVYVWLGDVVWIILLTTLR